MGTAQNKNKEQSFKKELKLNIIRILRQRIHEVAVGLFFILIINYFSPKHKIIEVFSFPSFYTALMYLSNISPWHFSGKQKHANFIPRSSLRSSIKFGDFIK